VITKINGKNVTTASELREYIGVSKGGETITVTVVRDGKEKEVPVKLVAESGR
jgi:S1-C subfamily serine protease